MQTFLPYPNFQQSARCLDNKRLGKQRVEAKQILEINLAIAENPMTKATWMNHPAVLMWRGYEFALAEYGYVICDEWITRGFRDGLKSSFWDEFCRMSASGMRFELPFWYGDKKFHLSHQSNLLRKDYNYYSYFFPNVPDNFPYYWPVKKESKSG